jgi:hypothetical protein
MLRLNMIRSRNVVLSISRKLTLRNISIPKETGAQDFRFTAARSERTPSSVRRLKWPLLGAPSINQLNIIVRVLNSKDDGAELRRLIEAWKESGPNLRKLLEGTRPYKRASTRQPVI